MKQIFTHLRQVAAATAVAVAALCPASLFAQGTVVASNTMSATTPDGVTIDLPIVSQGNWTIAPNGASAEIGTTGADNYGPCLAAPLPGSWIGVMVDVEEAGRYVFSFRPRSIAGSTTHSAPSAMATAPVANGPRHQAHGLRPYPRTLTKSATSSRARR